MFGNMAGLVNGNMFSRLFGNNIFLRLPENERTELLRDPSAHPFEPRPGVRVSLSISAGPARFPVDGSTFEELLSAADERMYRDKAGRRSRNSGRHALTQAERA